MNDEADRQYHALLLRMDGFLLTQWLNICHRLNSINWSDDTIQVAFLLGQFSAINRLMEERSEGDPWSDYLAGTEQRNALVEGILTDFGLKIEWRYK